jgi:ribosomal protein L40E
MLEQEMYKVCPECEGEYRLDVERCADCGVPLVYPEEIAARNARELPPTLGLAAVRTAPIDWVRALAADLARQGIRYRIDRRRARTESLLTLYVHRQDWKAAAAVDEARQRIEPLDEPEEDGAEGPAETELRPEEASYKVCPRCGGEYRLEAESCADCGAALIFPDGEPAGGGEEEEDAETETPLEEEPYLPDVSLYPAPLNHLPPGDDLVCLCCRPTRTLYTLSQALDEAGIAHRLEPVSFGPSRHVGCLYVTAGDGDAAAAVQDALLNMIPPGDELPAELAAELTVCPACGRPRPPGAVECRSCGLGFHDGTEEQTCSHCGAVVGFTSSLCPNCGTALRQTGGPGGPR